MALLTPLRLYAYQGYVTTDRPAYRPGQTAHIYGVYSEVRMHAEDARVVASKALTLEVINASYEKVQELKVQTDAFGRFSTSITLPRMVSRVTIVSALVRHRSAIKSSRLSSAVSSLSLSISARGQSSPSTCPSLPISMEVRSPSRGRCVRSVVAP